tara:strand:+ start:65 stop:256 length:192 start_codon:yes stop_codon:yes gene_type:complete
MTKERWLWYEKEIQRLREMDKRISDKVNARGATRHECSLPGDCNKSKFKQTGERMGFDMRGIK